MKDANSVARVATKIGVALALTAVGFDVLAAAQSSGPTLGAISKNINTSLADVSVLAEGVAYTAGFFFGLGALFKFKAYRDNPQQTSLGVPVTWLGIAVCLLALPTVMGGGMSTLFGGGTAVTMSAKPL